tara:strand:+ start:425 stop:715 length:291 start_codon:yes stop_codon:yes gene_type:complete
LGLKDIRSEVIKRLKDGHIQHDTDRAGDIDIKNLLLTGEVTVSDVIELINKTKGGQYESSPHHIVESVDVHIFKPNGWYVKFYFIDPDVIFISVHR